MVLVRKDYIKAKKMKVNNGYVVLVHSCARVRVLRESVTRRRNSSIALLKDRVTFGRDENKIDWVALCPQICKRDGMTFILVSWRLDNVLVVN